MSSEEALYTVCAYAIVAKCDLGTILSASPSEGKLTNTPGCSYLRQHPFVRDHRCNQSFIHSTNIYWVPTVCQALFQFLREDLCPHEAMKEKQKTYIIHNRITYFIRRAELPWGESREGNRGL